MKGIGTQVDMNGGVIPGAVSFLLVDGVLADCAIRIVFRDIAEWGQACLEERAARHVYVGAQW